MLSALISFFLQFDFLLPPKELSMLFLIWLIMGYCENILPEGFWWSNFFDFTVCIYSLCIFNDSSLVAYLRMLFSADMPYLWSTNVAFLEPEPFLGIYVEPMFLNSLSSLIDFEFLFSFETGSGAGSIAYGLLNLPLLIILN